MAYSGIKPSRALTFHDIGSEGFFVSYYNTKSPEGAGLFVITGKQLGGGGKRCLPG